MPTKIASIAAIAITAIVFVVIFKMTINDDTKYAGISRFKRYN